MNEVKNPKKPLVYYYAIVILVILALNFLAVPWLSQRQVKEVDYGTFMTMTENQEIGRVEVQNNQILFTNKDDTQVYKTGLMDDPDHIFRLKVSGAEFSSEIVEQMSPFLSFLLTWLLQIVFFVALGQFMLKRMTNKAGGPNSMMFGLGGSNAKVYVKSAEGIKFSDVAGEDEAKENLTEIVNYLHDPAKYQDIGASMPKGILLVGPPGTGKTMLAKAVAGEANVPFFSMSGSEFVEMFVGMGASKVRDLFKQAKEKAPCIVFIDEIDAVGRARGKNPNMGSNDERENTLNQMLTEMDGFSSNNGVIILAATNRADMLDKALMRPGRFDRQIYVDLPELTDRMEIFQVHLRNIKVNTKVDVEQLARQTGGFSGADIANVCNEAALIAARHNKLQVEWNDFMAAIDRIVGGMEKKSRIITPEEKNSIATHEAGHAVVSWLTQYGNPLVKVTIVPRGRALGAAWYSPEERQIVPTQALLDTMCGLLAGRAAEELFLGEVGTGASNDLERVTKIARAIVTIYGMSDRLPNINYQDSTGQEYGLTKPYAETTAAVIDAEVTRIIAEQYQRAKQILTQYAAQHHRLRDMLVEREVIFTADVEDVLGKRKWRSRTDEVMALNRANADKLSDADKEYDKEAEWERKQEAEADCDKASRKNESGKSVHPDNSDSADDDDPGTPPPFEKI